MSGGEGPKVGMGTPFLLCLLFSFLSCRTWMKSGGEGPISGMGAPPHIYIFFYFLFFSSSTFLIWALGFQMRSFIFLHFFGQFLEKCHDFLLLVELGIILIPEIK